MLPKRLARTTIYESDWIDLHVDKVRFPNGHIVERHHLLDHKRPAVVVLAENDQDQVLFVRVPRYTTGSVDWELPAGGMEAGETALETARREMLEETGYRIRAEELVYTFYPNNGIANMIFHVVHCKTGELAGDFDRNEISAVRWFDKDEIREMIDKRTLADGPSLIALFIKELK